MNVHTTKKNAFRKVKVFAYEILCNDIVAHEQVLNEWPKHTK